VRVTDQLGRPAALGARLLVQDGPYLDSAFGEYDRLVIGAAENRAGTYSLVLTRPGYHNVGIPQVDVVGDACGAIRTVTLSTSLSLLPGAPAVRNVVVIPPRVGLGLAGLQTQYRGYVDAAPGVDTTVTWSISDTAVAQISASGLAVAKCRTRWGAATVVARSTADTTVRGIGYLAVYANSQTCP